MTIYSQMMIGSAKRLAEEGKVGELETLVQALEYDAKCAEEDNLPSLIQKERNEILREVTFILNNFYASSPS